MVFYWVRKDFWLLHYWYQRFPQHPLLILNHLRSLQAPTILINKQLLDEVFVISVAAITVYFQTLKNVQLSDKQIFTVFIKEIIHCARNLQIIH